MSSAVTPIHIIARWFFKICIILFSYLVKYISRFWHLFLFAPVDHTASSAERAHISVCTGRSYYVISRARAHGCFHFDINNVNSEGNLCIFLSKLQEKRSSSNSLEKCFHIPQQV